MSPIFMQYYYWKRAFVFMLRCDSWQYVVQETSRLSNIKQMFCIKQCWALSLVSKNAEIFVNGKFCFKLEKNQVPGRDVHVKA